MPYQTKPGFLYVPGKRGDGELAPNKPKHLRLFDGMCGGYIDPEDWEIPPCISDYNTGEVLWIEIPKTEALKTLCVDASQPTINGNSVDVVDMKNPKFRQNKHFIDFQSLQPHIESQCPDFINKVYEHKHRIPVVKLNSMPAGVVKESKNIPLSRAVRKDVGQITIGTYTIGPGGGDHYPTRGGAGGGWAAAGNLTGNLSFVTNGPYTEVAIGTSVVNLNGFALSNPSNLYHGGSPLGGYLIQINHSGFAYSIQNEGPGNFCFCENNIRRTVAGSAANRSIWFTSAILVEFTLKINNNIIDLNRGAIANPGYGFRSTDVTPIVYIYSNYFYSGLYGVVIDAATGHANSIYSNNNFYDNAGGGGILLTNNPGIIRNNAFGGNGTDVVQVGGGTGFNNFSSDASCADGNFLAGAGNQINQAVIANGWQSVNDAEAAFLDIVQGGILDGAGVANDALTGRATCIRGRQVPGPNGTSVGAAERITPTPSAGITHQSHIAIHNGIAMM